MARINIEDSLWADPRFLRFCVKCGDEARAIGLIVMAFRLAQKHWCPHKRPIPFVEWEQAGLTDLLIECFCEMRNDGIYVRGSEAQFAWWFQRFEAGKKGGRPKADANREKADGNRPVYGAKRAKPSFSFSSSASISNQNKKTDLSASSEEPEDRIGEIIRFLNERCSKAFKANSETNRKLIRARLADGYSVEEFKKVIENKASKWLTDHKMRDYLRPNTLFREGNFEAYLNETPADKSRESEFAEGMTRSQYVDVLAKTQAEMTAKRQTREIGNA